MPKCLKLSVWSGPRNVSTALMYSFRQRPDTLVVDEPLYGHYLRVTDADHPGDEEVMASMDCDSECVIKEIILGPCERPIHFFKNMAHHLAGLDRGFLRRITNVLLEQFSKRMVPLVETRRVLSFLYSLNAEGSFLGKVHPFREGL